jgi:hypothetical protein
MVYIYNHRKNIMTRRILTIAAVAAIILTSVSTEQDCEKRFYAQKWNHQALITADAYNFVRAETDQVHS